MITKFIMNRTQQLVQLAESQYSYASPIRKPTGIQNDFYDKFRSESTYSFGNTPVDKTIKKPQPFIIHPAREMWIEEVDRDMPFEKVDSTDLFMEKMINLNKRVQQS